MGRTRHGWREARAVAMAPRVTVELSGPLAERFHAEYTAAHPRFKVVPRKRWGVALLPIPATVPEYLDVPARRHVRRKRRRAEAAGFAVRPFPTLERIPEILEIHRSAPVRQGQPMAAGYLKPKAVQGFGEAHPVCFGAFDRDDRLRAYAHAPVVGEVGIFHRLLGHADDLEHGIMFHLVSEVIVGWVAARRESDAPRWAMYDTLWGARPGLAEFKRRLGFEPYRVHWTLR